nr:unnamed protein product [Callosobruchus analis]
MDSTMYRDIVLDVMLPYARQSMPKGWIFQQDNDPKHRSKLLQQVFSQKKSSFIVAESISGSKSYREHLWQELKTVPVKLLCGRKSKKSGKIFIKKGSQNSLNQCPKGVLL